MKIQALRHPKVLDLAARLGVSLPTAVGHLEFLWAFTAEMAPAGDIGKWPDGAIARACEWQGDPQVFLQGLLQSRLLDEHEYLRVVVHDWADHCPRYVKAKVKALNLTFVSTVVATAVPGLKGGNPRTAVAPAVGNTTPRPTTPRQCTPCDPSPAVARTPSDPDSDTPSVSGPYPDESQRMDAYAELLLAYPKRAMPHGLLDEREYRLRIEDGVPHRQMVDGAQRFAEFVAAGGVSAPQYVMAVRNFLSLPNRYWLQPWEVPKPVTAIDQTIAAGKAFLAVGDE